MSAVGLERSQTNNANDYDHAISLVDDTETRGGGAAINEIGDGNVDASSDLSPVSRTESGALISRQWTKGHLRKELARRKYAKWQDGREADVTARGVEDCIGARDDGQEIASIQNTTRSGRLRDRVVPFRSKNKGKVTRDKENAIIDLLYENQRGGWFCGIPLYSSKSLLNFDPSGWTTSTFKDSAVNITNAQLPDPSWEWDWRCWYVDMSYDVDDEGWQYSFNFGSGWEWHGNHPWFHSFVRRRRWLRKRTRIHPHHGHLQNKGNANEAHLLNSDYFTIHAAQRERSRGSSTDRNTTNRSSLVGDRRSQNDSEDLSEISNLTALTNALKKARLDREKLSAVGVFLDQGGEELFYLAEYIPTIMGDVIHQTSRIQMQALLLKAFDNATSIESRNANDKKELALKRQVEDLRKAIEAAGVHIGNLTGTDNEGTKRSLKIDATEGTVISSKRNEHQSDDISNFQDGIKGISPTAQISQEPRIGFDNSREEESDRNSSRALEKGKGRA